MVIANFLPEILTVAAGAFGGYATTLFVGMRERIAALKAKRQSLTRELHKTEEWNRFISSELRSILEDRAITKSEWKEIITKSDYCLRTERFSRGNPELQEFYFERGEKGKRILLSEILEKDIETLEKLKNKVHVK